MRKIYIWLPALMLALVCGQTVIHDESFDPATLNEPEPEWPIMINPILNDSLIIRNMIADRDQTRQREGYRVQILTTRNAAEAENFRGIMSAILSDSCYVIYELPNYKVRAGDFINRRDAEELQNRLHALGYRSAWIVRTRVEPTGSNY
ncbi:MAG: SPOR domain-containing protein [Candidatus Neomarinimicrobiota bacterium]